MDSRSSTEAPEVAELLFLLGSLGLVFVASLIGELVLTVIVAAFSLIAVVWLGHSMIGGFGPRIVIAGLIAASIPVLGGFVGEPGLLLACGGGFVIIAATFAVAGNGKDAVKHLSTLLTGLVVTGFLGSYLVLIMRLDLGSTLIRSLLLMLLFYFVSTWVIEKYFPSRPVISGSKRPSWVSLGVGTLACVLAALASAFFLRGHLGIGPLSVLGFMVGAASAIGDFSAELLVSANDKSPHIWALVQRFSPTLLAAPAFFYGFRLYLT